MGLKIHRIAQYSDRGMGSVPSREGIFLLTTMSRPDLEPTQPPIQWVLEVEQPGHETDHSPSSSA